MSHILQLTWEGKVKRNEIQKQNIAMGRPMNIGLDPLRPCIVHMWTLEGEHKYCNICGIHHKDSKGKCV